MSHLTQKWHGLPVWAWAAIAAAVILLFYYIYRRRSASSNNNTAPAVASNATDPGQAYDYGNGSGSGGGSSLFPPNTGNLDTSIIPTQFPVSITILPGDTTSPSQTTPPPGTTTSPTKTTGSSTSTMVQKSTAPAVSPATVNASSAGRTTNPVVIQAQEKLQKSSISPARPILTKGAVFEG